MTHQVMADDFYVSGTFWLTVIVVGLTIVLVVLGWWTIRAGRHREPEIVWNETNQPLLTRSDPSVGDRLRVLWDDVPMDEAIVKTVTVRNLGHVDLKTTNFDGNRPIQFSYNERPLDVLGIQSTQSDGLISCEEQGGVVTIGPGILRKGETITVTLLYGAPTSGIPVFPLTSASIQTDAENVASKSKADARVTKQGITLLVLLLTIWGLLAGGQIFSGKF